MRPRCSWQFLTIACAALLAPAAWGQALTFHALTPCRIVDTRFGTGGPSPLAAGEARAFDAVSNDYRPQGGTDDSCGLPPFDSADQRRPAEAIAVNLVAVAAQGPGNLRVFPGDQPFAPLASVINYTTGQTIAVGTNIPLRTDALGDDFKVQADVSGAHVVIDVVGYYSRAVSSMQIVRLRNIPAAFNPGDTRRSFGVLNGVDFVTGVVFDHEMEVPPACSVARVQVEESVAVPPGGGARVYTLKAGPINLLACGTANNGKCKDFVTRTVLPHAAETLHWEVFTSGVVPATDASVAFELVCG